MLYDISLMIHADMKVEIVSYPPITIIVKDHQLHEYNINQA